MKEVSTKCNSNSSIEKDILDDINLDIVLEYFCIKKCVKAVCYKALKLYIFIWDNHNSYYLGSLIILVFLHYCYVYVPYTYGKLNFIIRTIYLILTLKISSTGPYLLACLGKSGARNSYQPVLNNWQAKHWLKLYLMLLFCA